MLPKAERDLNEGVGDRKLSDVFVPPPLVTRTEFSNPINLDDDLPDRKEVSISFDQFAYSPSSFVVYGKPEYGKTTLLKQTALQILQQRGLLTRLSIPAIISFGDISKGRDKIERLIRASISAELPEVSLSQLLVEGYVTLLIDDVIFGDQSRFPVLSDFVERFPKNRYILASDLDDASRFTAIAVIGAKSRG